MEYSHSDVLIELENGAAAMLEIVQSQLNSGSYNLKFKPTETTIDYRLSKNGEESMKYLKITCTRYRCTCTCMYYIEQNIQL